MTEDAATLPVPAKVYLWSNDMVMTFDAAGDQIPGLQGPLSGELVRRLDQPRDPVADLRAACARITAAHRPAVSTPLEFDVPDLAGHEVHRAGPDVAINDQAAFQSHAFTLLIGGECPQCGTILADGVRKVVAR